MSDVARTEPRARSVEHRVMQPRVVPALSFVRSGVLAGLVGAVAIDAYLLLTLVVAAHALSAETFYRYVASGVLGPAAYASPIAVPLGAALHVGASVGWGIGYAYLYARTPQVRTRPLTSAIVYGILVMLAMQLVEVQANIYTLPNSWTLLNAFVAHIVFFAFPVAAVVARLERS